MGEKYVVATEANERPAEQAFCRVGKSRKILRQEQRQMGMAKTKPILHDGGSVHTDNRSALSYSHARKCRGNGVLSKGKRLATK